MSGTIVGKLALCLLLEESKVILEYLQIENFSNSSFS